MGYYILKHAKTPTPALIVWTKYFLKVTLYIMDYCIIKLKFLILIFNNNNYLEKLWYI